MVNKTVWEWQNLKSLWNSLIFLEEEHNWLFAGIIRLCPSYPPSYWHIPACCSTVARTLSSICWFGSPSSGKVGVTWFLPPAWGTVGASFCVTCFFCCDTFLCNKKGSEWCFWICYYSIFFNHLSKSQSLYYLRIFYKNLIFGKCIFKTVTFFCVTNYGIVSYNCFVHVVNFIKKMLSYFRIGFINC